jgi:uncharacterized membrane protein
MMWGYDDQFHQANHGWLMLGMGIFWLVVIAVVIWLVVRLTERRPGHHGGHPMQHPDAHLGENSPRAILDKRLVNGEIDAEKYADIKKLLEL